jgi:hypothetical protein
LSAEVKISHASGVCCAIELDNTKIVAAHLIVLGKKVMNVLDGGFK